MDGTYETKLLRLLIGHFHVSQMELRARLHYEKPLSKLTPDERKVLEDELVAQVVGVAESISEEKLTTTLAALPWMN
jgi:hypothetical protein